MSTDKTKLSNKAKVSLKNIGRFIQGYTRSFSDALGLLEEHKREQVIWRAEQAKECTENGSCVYCGCTTPAKYYSDEGCENPDKMCYPEMLSKDTWEHYKKMYNITVKID